jgi:hypothetical protein
VFETNQHNRKTSNRINPNRNRIKPHLIWMYLDHFFTQPYGLVQSAVFILPTELNQTKPQYKEEKTTKHMSPRPILVETQ